MGDVLCDDKCVPVSEQCNFHLTCLNGADETNCNGKQSKIIIILQTKAVHYNTLNKSCPLQHIEQNLSIRTPQTIATHYKTVKTSCPLHHEQKLSITTLRTKDINYNTANFNTTNAISFFIYSANIQISLPSK